jgi:hypothetical protein
MQSPQLQPITLKLAEQLARLFHKRPKMPELTEDNKTTWERYGEDDAMIWLSILRKLPKGTHIAFSQSYHPSSHNLTIVIYTDIENTHGIGESYDFSQFRNCLSGESGHEIQQAGVEYYQFTLVENY